MTLLCRNLEVLLLFLVASPHLYTHHFTNAASTSPPATRPRIIFMTSSDDDDDDSQMNSPPPNVLVARKTTVLQKKPELCQYNPCLENQEPCDQISARTGCLCPGVSGADKLPHAPQIQMLLPLSAGVDRGKIEVQWCAPSSVVSGYRLVIEGREAETFTAASRRGLVGPLEIGTKVCVEAVNKAGHSIPSKFSCKRYDHPETSDHKLFAGVIGGGIALLLLVIITAVICWKFQLCKKAKRDSADGLGNPSYSTQGTL